MATTWSSIAGHTILNKRLLPTHSWTSNTVMNVKKLSTLQEIQVNYERNYGKTTISDSSKAQSICREAFILTKANIQLKEYFYFILLNRANEVIGYHKLSEGGISGTVADIRLAYSTAIKCLASGMILCHNHPSGNIKPSQADIKLTQKFKEAGKLLDCALLDHIILTEKEFFSFADSECL
jgi:DNA repair protein RadC